MTHALDLGGSREDRQIYMGDIGILDLVRIGLGQNIRGLSTLDGFGTDIKRILLSRPWPSMVGLH